MAEGFLKTMLPLDWKVYSAGIAKHGINPYAAKVMLEEGIDIRGYSSNHVEEYKELPFSAMLSLCDHARANCPWFPAEAELIHQHFVDPADAKGVEEEKLRIYRATRDALRDWLPGFVERLRG